MSRIFRAILRIVALPLEYKSDHIASADVIVVLGTVVYTNGIPSPSMEFRVSHGVRLLQEGYASAIIFTGGCSSGGHIESLVMKQLALSYGVKEQDIYAETSAVTTYENALFTSRVMAQKKWQRAILVTSPYHLKRALLIFRKAGIDVQGSPAFSSDVYPLSKQFSVLVHEYIAWTLYFLHNLFKVKLY